MTSVIFFCSQIIALYSRPVHELGITTSFINFQELRDEWLWFSVNKGHTNLSYVFITTGQLLTQCTVILWKIANNNNTNKIEVGSYYEYNSFLLFLFQNSTLLWAIIILVCPYAIDSNHA